MKASVINSFGEPRVLEYADVPTPTPSGQQVLIKVEACGINHYDIFFRRGQVNKKIPLPHVMGADVVGEIESCGADVTGLSRGQRVIVAPGFPLQPGEYDHEPINFAPSYEITGGAQWGGYAECMVCAAAAVITDPPDLPSEQLATLPLVLVTAVHATRTLGQVGPGQKVLVQAGASGSGAMCVQVARALGAQVAATVGSSDKFDFVRGLGAEVIVNYREESFVDRVKEWTGGRGVDAVIDNVGGSAFDDNIRSLKRGGQFVNFGMVGGGSADYSFPLVFYKQLHLHGSMMGSMAELHWGLEQVRAGKIKPILDKTFPLREAAAAHRYIEDRKVQGKVVLLP